MGSKTGKNARKNRKKKVSRKCSESSSHDALLAKQSKLPVSGKKVRFSTNKKIKITLKHKSARDTNDTYNALKEVKKEKSILLKKQAKERMVFKAHLQQLRRRRAQTTRSVGGKDEAKHERREIGKYIRELQKQQTDKHAAELKIADAAVNAARCHYKPQSVTEGAGDVFVSDSELDENDADECNDIKSLFSNLLS